MLTVLANRTYRHLVAAQIIALIVTGLATVALGLLAYNIAGANAGAVLGTALAIKMVAYIGVAPVVGAFAYAPKALAYTPARKGRATFSRLPARPHCRFSRRDDSFLDGGIVHYGELGSKAARLL